MPINMGNRRSNGVGNRRRLLGNQSRPPLELRAMGAQLVNGSVDPEPVYSTIKVKHRIQLVLVVPTGGLPVTVAMITSVIPGSASWSQFRIMKLSAWGTDVTGTPGAGVVAPLPPLSIQFPGSTSNMPDIDSATFSDWGTAGAARANLHIIPSFSQRQGWQPVSTTSGIVQFTVVTGVAESNVIVNLSLELQSVTTPLPNFRTFSLPVHRPDIIPGLNGLRISGDEDRPD